MKSKDDIIEILLNEFSCVYCDTCAHDMDDETCEWCHRKSMNWALSKDVADRIAGVICDGK